MKPVCTLIAALLLTAPAALGVGPQAAPQVGTQSSGAVPAIPEPAAFALFVLGAGVLGAAIRRRKA